MKCIEPMHVNNCGIYTQLVTVGEKRKRKTFAISCLFTLAFNYLFCLGFVKVIKEQKYLESYEMFVNTTFVHIVVSP